MAIVDVQSKTVTLKIVYYGCALGGKTTNLQTLHRLTDPQGRHRMLSVATKDDRTLFFDLLPLALGQVRGLSVRAKVYTVPGQIHYELTRRQVVAGTDGVVLVVDSSQSIKDNEWALENVRLNLRANGLDPDETPIVLQWNKRDLPAAHPVPQLEAALNPDGRPAFEAVATDGPGVVDTFAAVLRAALVQTYAKSGIEVPEEALAQCVESALAEARTRQPEISEALADVHRVDDESYREEQAEHGRNRRVMDLEHLLGEAVQTGMTLAERVDDLEDERHHAARRSRMMQALAQAAPVLADPSRDALPRGIFESLLAGTGRRHGSLLTFGKTKGRLDEREVLPAGHDPLNEASAAELGSVAFRLAAEAEPRWIEDLVGEMLFDAAPGAHNLASAYFVPLRCDGLRFGALVAYGAIDESVIDEVEREYWQTVGALLGLSLHWHALRRKLAASSSTAP